MTDSNYFLYFQVFKVILSIVFIPGDSKGSEEGMMRKRSRTRLEFTLLYVFFPYFLSVAFS